MMESKFEVFLGPAGRPGITQEGTLEGVKDVAALGLNAMEVEFVYGIRMSMKLAEQIGREAKEKNVRLSIHAPYYINLCTDDDKKLKGSKTRILESVKRAEAMAAHVVVFHPGFYGRLEKEEAFERVVTACEEMAEKTPSSISLGLETTGKSGAFGTLDEIVQVCRKVPGCVPVMDFAHIFARQNGGIDYEKVLDDVKPLRLKCVHAHFSNVEFTAKGERSHLPLDSQPPFEPLAREILRRKQSITIISESPLLEIDSLKMKRIFENVGYKF